MTTVRQDLETALEEAAVWTDAEGNKHWCSGIGLTVNIKRMECRVKCLPARAAIDRARAEPEESICTAACDQPSEAHCSDCGCYQAGYQAGTEAQREPAGGRTA